MYKRKRSIPSSNFTLPEQGETNVIGLANSGEHAQPRQTKYAHHVHTAVKRGARAQFPPKLSLNKVLNFRKFSLSSPKLRQSLKS